MTITHTGGKPNKIARGVEDTNGDGLIGWCGGIGKARNAPAAARTAPPGDARGDLVTAPYAWAES
jgi:hypothetical protein